MQETQYPLYSERNGYVNTVTAKATVSTNGQSLTVVDENIDNEDDFIQSAYHFNLYYIWCLFKEGIKEFSTPFGTLREEDLSDILSDYEPKQPYSDLV